MDTGVRSESAEPGAAYSGLPPGPRNRLLQTFTYMRNPFRYHARCTARYGDLYTIPSLIGTIVMTAHPDGARELFSLDAECHEPFAVDSVEPILGASSLLLLHGEPHKRERKLLMPPFHGSRMRAYGEMIRQTALSESGHWRFGQVINLQTAMLRISMQVILRAVFGVVEPGLSVRYEAAVSRLLTAGHPLLMVLPALQHELFGRGPWAQFLRARQDINALIYPQIAAARERHEPAEDILSLLVSARHEDGSAMTDSEVRDELLTLLLAGHETSAQALSWAFYYLHRDPARLARLHAEIAALGENPEPEVIAAQPYLESVCNEALRLNPVVAEVARQLRKPTMFAGYMIPAGVALGVSIFGIHRCPKSYSEPARFVPERFLERKFSPFEFIPFGGGTRRCVGAAFALYEMKLVLFSLLQRYTFSPTSLHPIEPELRGLTMGPKGGMPMRIGGLRSSFTTACPASPAP